MVTRRTEAGLESDPFGLVDDGEGVVGDWAAHDAGPTQQSIKAKMSIVGQSNRSIIQPLSTNGFT